jgi:hypothetical protein
VSANGSEGFRKSAGPDHCPRKRLHMAIRQRCVVLLNAFVIERVLARPMNTATW